MKNKTYLQNYTHGHILEIFLYKNIFDCNSSQKNFNLNG